MKIFRAFFGSAPVAALAVSLSWGVSQEAKPSRAPKIHFDTLVHDFGQVSNGHVVTHDFKVANVGSAPLEITKVKPSCGCTLAGEWPKLLRPGESGLIPVRLKTDNLRGPTRKTISVESDDPNQRVARLELRGQVRMLIDYPSNVTLPSLKSRDEVASKTVKIVNNTDDPLNLGDIRTSNPKFLATLKPVKHGREFELTISTVPPLEYRANRSHITIATSNPDAAEIAISTYVNVPPPVDAVPRSLTLFHGQLKKPTAKYVTVSNRTGGKLALSDASVDIEGVTIAVDERNDGRYYRYKLTFPAGYKPPRDLKAGFSFKTDNKEFPEFRIPIKVAAPRPTTPSRPTL